MGRKHWQSIVKICYDLDLFRIWLERNLIVIIEAPRTMATPLSETRKGDYVNFAFGDAMAIDRRLLVDSDGGLEGKRGRAARILLYLMGRDAAVGLLRGGNTIRHPGEGRGLVTTRRDLTS